MYASLALVLVDISDTCVASEYGVEVAATLTVCDGRIGLDIVTTACNENCQREGNLENENRQK